jgi:hypothetical protein
MGQEPTSPNPTATGGPGHGWVRRLRLPLLRPADPVPGWPPGPQFMLPGPTPPKFWELHDRHRSDPLAEEIAWVAAGATMPSDECDAGCVLHMLNGTLARYWATYPEGRWIHEALGTARPRLEYASWSGCFGGEEEAAAEADAFRETLREVTAPGREGLLDLVARIERRCNLVLPRLYEQVRQGSDPRDWESHLLKP